ncbi:NAD(P)/FAD-dependent oxidoreductase [Tuwongella immobilis]|uniref:FAD dependent oxidoreductase domain-containing protein n=1 Tax=Tuwongella immobilis TaxID=692036 RepID=A0A6C2YQ29_9BACT|nr:d-amino acid oxidase : Glycine oxidase ThiO OS=Pirellula staleyi (strain ATCC 27377 / DSM 6068 / ICPB 4128) GN=Psta_4394 PE=4 SV=1: DAO [Tuwongella immobilis]VTS03463.1 d-amino acid oxidase : Glycine oxidase ThiO OS=Pirellula staleyi (strain ATCC 27377 / DSM 6068 / ICPB 4128) GN=Psta_4394 PE=4 SV=1: DAO [Tuwongella immobilis]
MATNTDILIVGGGVIGLTSAYFLARSGCSVIVLEQSADPGRQASWAGAGIIPPGNPERVTSATEKLRAFSVSEIPSFSETLRELTGIDNGYRRCGGIEIFTPEEAEIIPSIWRREGIAFEELNACSLGDIEPELMVPNGSCNRRSESPVSEQSFRTFRLPGMGQIRNPWHIRAMIRACELVGVRIIRNHPVTDVVSDGDQIEHVRAADRSWTAEKYLFTAGAWTNRLLQEVGHSLPIFPVRGQMVLFKSDTRLFSSVVIIGKRYLVPREDGHVLVGSTEEPEVGFELGNTESEVESLKTFAFEWFPTLQSTPIVKCWSGLRPGSQDGFPYLGQLPTVRNGYVAAGHFRAGLQLSVGTGILMNELLMGHIPSIDLSPFRPDRSPIAVQMMAFRS